jgi:hypothetical protein
VAHQAAHRDIGAHGLLADSCELGLGWRIPLPRSERKNLLSAPAAIRLPSLTFFVANFEE